MKYPQCSISYVKHLDAVCLFSIRIKSTSGRRTRQGRRIREKYYLKMIFVHMLTDIGVWHIAYKSVVYVSWNYGIRPIQLPFLFFFLFFFFLCSCLLFVCIRLLLFGVEAVLKFISICANKYNWVMFFGYSIRNDVALVWKHWRVCERESDQTIGKYWFEMHGDNNIMLNRIA